PICSSPCSMIHSVVSSRSALLAKVSLPSMERPPRAGGLTSSTTDLSLAMTTFSPAAGTLRFGQVAGSDQREADASWAWAPADTPAIRKLESTDKTSNERDSLCMQSTPKLERKTPNPGPQRIARAPRNGIDHG